jgi:tRNA G46 methylase TrmB
MARQKNKRFEALSTYKNVLEWSKNGGKKAQALQELLMTTGLILELGCGKGEHILALGERHPGDTCIGVDIKGERLYVGARQAQEQSLENVWFIRAPIEVLLVMIPAESVSQVWITFCDPQVKKPSKCLASSLFFAQYTRILSPHGSLILKTDSQFVADLYEKSAVDAGFLVQKNYKVPVIVTSAFEKKWKQQGIATIVMHASKKRL